jgi:hypothetical protein
MFLMTMPDTFKIGDTETVRINGQAATLTWRDAGTLVVNGTDARTILRCAPGGPGLIDFMCGDPGEPGSSYGADGPIVFRRHAGA